ERGTSNTSLILDNVATADAVWPFSILDKRLLEIPHSSATCCCVFLYFRRACLIFFPMFCKFIVVRSLHIWLVRVVCYHKFHHRITHRIRQKGPETDCQVFQFPKKKCCMSFMPVKKH